MMLIPGPVNVPRSVAQNSTVIVNHRSEKFRGVVAQLEQLLKGAFFSSRVALLSGSGTLAVESMVFSLLKRGEKVIVLTYGEFSERLLDSVVKRGASPVVYRKPFGEIFSEDEIKEILDINKDATAIAFVHNETSTGMAFRNLRRVVGLAKDRGLKVLVDSVSGFGAYEIRVNDWNIDAVATGSQKALASVPGMGLVGLSEEGIRNLQDDAPNYLNLKLHLKFQDRRETPFTPAVGVFFSTLRATELLHQEGVERRWKRHEACARFVRSITSKAGFSLLGNESNFSNTVVAGSPPISPKSMIDELAKRGIEISGGMGELKDKIVRIGTLGMIDDRAVLRLRYALSDILKLDLNEVPTSDCKLPEVIAQEIDWDN
ncbi:MULTISPECIES: pyridoxal-phosphate-dependent aminotransferase family protein [Metallosphaera]|nr:MULTISPECIES: alanine--glyoxylate aminotransferase family protein [Metallosphaera]AKV74663.1 hydrogenase expression protein HypE [Metallosphaera sedula]AKV76900.1 hydrogenase expression protein HypE [Metallosphaera sedula]AKV79151.1 hydrogenase expression protein HypE [Metallosphaera sedula]AKV81396.1 hydrogenase expression protein HypE [Metallosphaera sedula]AKV83631.1 hydrogenase expression protein HypE [Metallosphaera sedula]